MLTINNLTKKFKKKKALDNVSFDFEEGVYGLLGANGAGKTTLMRCITKLYPTKSEISYRGVCINKDKDYLLNVGYLPQKFGVFKDLTVKEAMELFANLKEVDKYKAKEQIERAIDIVNLSDRMDSKVGALSGGMVRRLGIAQTLLNSPQIIIFDEPTAGLDPEERLRFKNIINEIKHDKIIIISTHIVEDVEAICNKIAIMKSGKIIANGSSSQIRDFAENKVYLIPESEEKNIIGEYQIEKKTECDGKIMIRIITNTPQNMKAANSTIEDGYICIIRNI